jgi:hypothetical protein
MGKPLRAGSRSAPLRSPGIGPLPSQQGSVNLQGLKDIQLYQQLLGFSGIWKVTHVDLKLQERTVEVRVECQ